MRKDNLTDGNSPPPEELRPSELAGYGTVEQMQKWLAEAEAQHDYERAYNVCTFLFLTAFTEGDLEKADTYLRRLYEIEEIAYTKKIRFLRSDVLFAKKIEARYYLAKRAIEQAKSVVLEAFPEVPLSHAASMVDLLGEIACIEGNIEFALELAEMYVDATIFKSKLIKHGIMISYFNMASFHIPSWLGWLVFHLKGEAQRRLIGKILELCKSFLDSHEVYTSKYEYIEFLEKFKTLVKGKRNRGIVQKVIEEISRREQEGSALFHPSPPTT